MRSAFIVYNAVLNPICAAACAASQPAWPAPTTTTSYFSSNIATTTFLCRTWKRCGRGYHQSRFRPLVHPKPTNLDTNPAAPFHEELSPEVHQTHDADPP